MESHPYTPPPQVRKAPARAPVQGDKPGIEHLPDEVQEEVRARREAQEVRLDPWSDEVKARMKRYALACGLCFPILVKLCSGTPLGHLPIEVLVGAAYGAFIAFRRSGKTEAGAALCFCGLLCQAIAGTLAVTFMMIFTFMIYSCIGAVLGLHHEMRAWDGQ